MSGKRTLHNTRWRERHAEKAGMKCHWCDVAVVMPPKGISQSEYVITPNMATTDHLYHRWDIRRRLERSATKVLACFKCNQERRLEMTDAEWFKVEKIDIRDLIINNA